MTFNLDNLSSEESTFYNGQLEFNRRDILQHLNTGLSFYHSVLTEKQESLTLYYEWIKNNVKDLDKYKVTDFDNRHRTNYTGGNLTQYEKNLFEKLPNVGKWQVGNYSRMLRGLQEAHESLYEFMFQELNYLSQPFQ
tara:strand:- start:1674 stop:2084 length:411 start_codon:yes stop_codon:yes gene_type:complete